jgi:hypothetical protein
MMPDHDARDEALAARLDVEPLDELTRRRLVARAMAATDDDVAPAAEPAATPHLLRWFAVAAAVLVVVVIGSVAVLRTGGSDHTEVASRQASGVDATARDAAGSEQTPGKSAGAATGASPSTAPGTSSTTAGLGVALGDFGDLSKAAARRRVLAAIDAAGLTAAPADLGSSSAGDPACPSEQLAPILATATGTYHDRPAEVVVTERSGTRHVLLLIANPCEVRQLR